MRPRKRHIVMTREEMIATKLLLRKYYHERNQRIYEDITAGTATIAELAQRYHHTERTIARILAKERKQRKEEPHAHI